MLRARAVFPIAGRAGKDHQVGIVEPIEHFVEINKMGGDACDAGIFGPFLLISFLPFLELFEEGRFEFRTLTPERISPISLPMPGLAAWLI